jgi:lantibiotic modifying enzyme
LIQVIDEIEKQCKHKTNGAIRCLTIIGEKGKTGYNISLSHGIASVIVFLSKVYSLGFSKEKVYGLLDGTVNYLLSQQLDSRKFNSCFPNFDIKSAKPFNSRLSWCYGDLGIGISLFQASLATKNKKLEEKTINLLLHSTKRKDLDENLVKDAGLCHGTAGIAHIYNRMYQYTHNEKFKDSACYWFDETLKMAYYRNGLAGYKAGRPEKQGGAKNEAGFLEGIAGIGLALISAISNIEPTWDECLLLS